MGGVSDEIERDSEYFANGRPFDAHGRQRQHRAHGRHVLDVVRELAKEDAVGPRVGHEFGHLRMEQSLRL